MTTPVDLSQFIEGGKKKEEEEEVQERETPQSERGVDLSEFMEGEKKESEGEGEGLENFEKLMQQAMSGLGGIETPGTEGISASDITAREDVTNVLPSRRRSVERRRLAIDVAREEQGKPPISPSPEHPINREFESVKDLIGMGEYFYVPGEDLEMKGTLLGTSSFSEGLRIAWHGVTNPIETGWGIISFPFITGFNAVRDLATTSAVVSPELNEQFKKTLGEMDPAELEMNRRGMLAFALTPFVHGAASIAFKGFSSRLMRAGVFSKGTAKFASKKATTLTSLAAFGKIAAPEEEGTAQAVGFTVMAAPFVLGLAPLLAMRNRGMENASLGDVSQFRMSRAFDEIGLEEVRVRGVTSRDIPAEYSLRRSAERVSREILSEDVKTTIGEPISDQNASRIVEAVNEVGAEAFNERVSIALESRGNKPAREVVVGEAVRIVNDRRAARQIEPPRTRDVAEPKTEIERTEPQRAEPVRGRATVDELLNDREIEQNVRTARVGEMPSRQELQRNASVLQGLMESSTLDVIGAIVRAHKDLDPKRVTIIPQVDNLGDAIPKIKEIIPDVLISTYKRSDGTYDIAIGGPESGFRGYRAQFENYGHYTGESVSIRGKLYEYYTTLPDGSVLVESPTGKGRVRFDGSLVGRAGWGNEGRVIKMTPETLESLKDALEPSEFMEFQNLLREMNPTDGKMAPVGDINSAADANGFMVRETSPGRWTVLDAETGRVVKRRFKSKAEATEYMDQVVQEYGPQYKRRVRREGRGKKKEPGTADIRDRIASDYEAKFEEPVEQVLNAAMPSPEGGGTGLPRPTNFPSPRLFSPSRFTGWLQQTLAEHARWITDSKTIFEALDNKYGTQFVNEIYFPTQDGFLKAKAAAVPYLNRLKRIEKTLKKIGEEGRENIFRYIETMSYNEMLYGGLQVNRLPTGYENLIARFWARNNVRNDKLGQFLLDLNSLKESQKARMDRDLTGSEIKRIRAELAEEYGFSPAEITAVRQLEAVLKKPMNEASVYNIRRLANALMDETPTREQFARDNNMNATQLKAAADLETLFRDIAIKRQIPDERLLRGYINHAREYGMGDVELTFLKQRATGELREMQEFMFDKVRTGEINEYNLDPIQSTALYIKAGFDHDLLMRPWNRARNIAKAEAIRRAGEKYYENTELYQNATRYLNDLRGIPSASTLRFQDHFAKTLKRLGIEKEVNFQRDVVNTILAMQSASAMAFRVGLGLRDFYDYFFSFGAKVGYTRAWEAFSRTNPLKTRMFRELKEQGEITGQTHIEFGRPGEAVRGKVGRFAERGLKASLQPTFHEWMQAAAFYDMWKIVPKELNRVTRGKQSLETAYRRIKADTFNEVVRNKFDALVQEGKIEEATRYLAKASQVEVAGRYGMGNNPAGWRTNRGRVLTQFGTWSVQRRTYLMRNLSEGSAGNRLAFAARFAMGQAALAFTGRFLGFNLGSWYTLPGLVFRSPILQHMINVGLITGGSERDRDRGITAFQRLFPTSDHPASLYIPGSYAFYDVKKALTDPRIEDPVRGIGRMIGIPISDKEPEF